MNLFNPGDIVAVNFPGVTGIKRRPAVILSSPVYHAARLDVIVGLITSQTTKPLVFLGSSQDDLRGFPPAVRHALGVELMRVQFGGEPTDCKPMPTVGSGAYELQIQIDEQNRSPLERYPRYP